MKILLFDTDVLIDLLRGKEETKNQLADIIPESYLYCSVITISEIFAGMLVHEESETESLLHSLLSVPVSPEIARKAGLLRNEYKRIELADCIIAATALELNAHLLTKNVKHYPMRGLNLIQIV